MKEKYTNGKANATEYNESRTAWMKAVSDRLQAKYDYVHGLELNNKNFLDDASFSVLLNVSIPFNTAFSFAGVQVT